MKAVPFFLRPMVRKSIEKAAKEKGVSIITSELIDEVKKH
ncbi:MAG: PCP reductase family protein [Nitrospirae bacterium]|nr:PCP reductase family protein [Nitrospirota bacterium]